MDTDLRYMHSAFINMGEAVAALGNLMQRGQAKPGSDVMTVKLALLRAIASLEGVPYVPPPGVIG